MSENTKEEGGAVQERLSAIRSANQAKLKELAALMDRAAENPDASDDDLEQVLGLVDWSMPHRLDTAANGCNG